MDLETILPLAMFFCLFLAILSGFPVAFTLAGTAFAFALIGYSADIFMLSDFGFIPSKVFGIVQNVTLLAVPLFVFMGVTLEKSGIAEDLLNAMERLLSRVRGGLTIALILVGALLAASTGIVGATVVTMGVLALPTMLQRSYDKKLATGTIAASGTLGQIIPPSIVLVLLGDMMNVAVADLFAGAIIPGTVLVLCYILYVFTRVMINPALAPPLESPAPLTIPQLLTSLLPPLFLIWLVLGTILLGVASPTEAAACGAVGALLLAFIRRKLSLGVLKEIADQTTAMSAMVFTLLIGAQFFSVVFRGLYGDELITDFILDLEVSRYWVLFIVMLIMFALGFFLDFIEICFIIVPLVAPILTLELGMNGIWIAILFAVNLQTSFLTPPFGFALFYLKGVAPPEVTTADIYRGIIPYVLIQLLVLVLLFSFPALVTFLPAYFFGS
jgi:tripartite ATP-independent transporter DctM subunit